MPLICQINENPASKQEVHLRNEFDFWKAHGIRNTSSLLQSKGFTLTLQETRSIHDSMNLPKIKFIAYIYSLL